MSPKSSEKEKEVGFLFFAKNLGMEILFPINETLFTQNITPKNNKRLRC